MLNLEAIMRPWSRRALGALIAILIALFTSGLVAAQQSKGKDQKREVTKLELRISKDGSAIIDQHGKVVAKFVEGMKVQLAKDKNAPMTMRDVTAKLEGCMCCTNECVIYDRNGVCVRWTRSCTWDFDCGCR